MTTVQNSPSLFSRMLGGNRQQDIKNLQNEKAELRAQLEREQNEKQELFSQMNALIAEVADMDTKLQVAEMSKKSFEIRREEIENEAKLLKLDKEKCDKEIQRYKMDLDLKNEQFENTKKFYEEEKKELEKDIKMKTAALQSLKLAKQEKKEDSDKVMKLTKEKADLMDEIDQLQNDIDRKNKNLADKESTILELENQILKKKEEIKNLENSLNEKEDTINENKKEILSLKEKIKNLEFDRQTSIDQITNLEQKNEAMKEELHKKLQSDKDDGEQKIELMEKIDKLEEHIQLYELQKREFESLLKSKEEQNKSMESDKNDAIKALEERTLELKDLTKVQEDKVALLEESRDELIKKISKMEETNNELNGLLKRKDEEIRKLNVKIDESMNVSLENDNRINSYEDELNVLRSKVSTLQRQYEETKIALDNEKSIKLDLIEKESTETGRLVKKIEELNKEMMNKEDEWKKENVKLKNDLEDQFQKMIKIASENEMLKNEVKNDAKLEQVKKDWEEKENILKLDIEKIELEKMNMKKELESELNSLKEEIIAMSKNKDEEINNLRLENNKNFDMIQKISSQNEQLKIELNSEDKIKAIREECEKKEIRLLEEHKNEINILKANIDENKSFNEKHLKEIEEQKREISKLREENDKNFNLLQTTSSENEQLKIQLKSEDKINVIKDEFEKKQNELLSSHNDEINKYKKIIEQQKLDIKILQTDAENVDGVIRKMSIENEELKTTIKGIENIQNLKEDFIRKESIVKDSYLAEIEKYMKTIEDKDNEINKLRDEILEKQNYDEVMRELSEVKNNLMTTKNHIKELEDENNKLREQIVGDDEIIELENELGEVRNELEEKEKEIIQLTQIISKKEFELKGVLEKETIRYRELAKDKRDLELEMSKLRDENHTLRNELDSNNQSSSSNVLSEKQNSAGQNLTPYKRTMSSMTTMSVKSLNAFQYEGDDISVYKDYIQKQIRLIAVLRKKLQGARK